MSFSDFSSPPDYPPDSPGSSVSTRLQDEYDELLKFAVVVPSYDPAAVPKTLMDFRESFPQQQKETLVTLSRQRVTDEESLSEAESSATPIQVKVMREPGLPDFGQSPIRNEKDRSDLNPKYISQKEAYEPQPRPPLDFDCDEKQSEQDCGGETRVMFSATIDPDVCKMETLMDQWCLDLKRNVLAEFSQSKIRIVELGRQKLMKEQEKHASEKNKMLNEIDSLKELLHTYEQSIQRKDQVISNLTHALQKQRERSEMTKKFCEWKIKHNYMKREAFASNLAYRHHERKLCQKVWAGWHSIIEAKWRHRVEKACQAKAQEVCIQLTNDYENRMASLNEALEAARIEVNKLHIQRDHYEETMKKAFMRGVCALNMEAMSMFQSAEENPPVSNGQNRVQEDYSDNLESSIPEKDYSVPKTIPQEPLYNPPQSKVISGQGSRTVTQSKSITAPKAGLSSRGKVVTAKISAKEGRPLSGQNGTYGVNTVAPPMSSVIVERHQPVCKQTIGHAKASKYPLTDQQAGISHRRIAGQTGPINVSPSIQTVKVVD
ncbi:hypothetical protein ScPMuIL_002573 [Solemya velum]